MALTDSQMESHQQLQSEKYHRLIQSMTLCHRQLSQVIVSMIELLRDS